MRCGARCGPEEGRAWGGGIASGMHGESPTQGLGARARAGRTENMPYMFVTLEVSQLEMSTFPKWSRKSQLMSVMAETHQSAMGPYVAMAEAAFELNSVTAVFREALLVKVWVQAPVGGEGEVLRAAAARATAEEGLGSAAMEWCSFPEPSSSHRQR
jgi:hypothetical protein